MKQYVIDQLRPQDHQLVKAYLDEKAEKAVFEGLYWVDFPEDLLTTLQAGHESCHPFYFAVNLSEEKVEFELLVRSRRIIRCNCIAYATPAQRDYIIRFADEMLENLDLLV